jgi:hypothetical protein
MLPPEDAMEERRASPRFPIRWEIHCETGIQVLQVQGFDLNEDGLSFLTSATLPVNTEAVLRYRFSAEDPLVTARVLIRYQVADRVGVQFLDLKHEPREHTPLSEQEQM